MSLYYPWPRPCLLPPLLLASSVSNKPTNRQRQRHAPTHLTKTRRASFPSSTPQSRTKGLADLMPTPDSGFKTSSFKARLPRSISRREERATHPATRRTHSDLRPLNSWPSVFTTRPQRAHRRRTRTVPSASELRPSAPLPSKVRASTCVT